MQLLRMELIMNAVVQELPEGFNEFWHGSTLLAYQPSTGRGFRSVMRGSEFLGWRELSYNNDPEKKQTCFQISNKTVRWHRIIAQHFLNDGRPLLTTDTVDHIKHRTGLSDQDALNNLRIVSNAQNSQNRKRCLNAATQELG